MPEEKRNEMTPEEAMERLMGYVNKCTCEVSRSLYHNPRKNENSYVLYKLKIGEGVTVPHPRIEVASLESFERAFLSLDNRYEVLGLKKKKDKAV